MTALIVSRNFNPGHFSHLVANYRLFEELGYKPYLYVDRMFNDMDEAGAFRKINAPSDLRGLETISVVVFWFPSLWNVVEMVRLRLISCARIIYVFHEPLDSIAAYSAAGFGWLTIAKILLINLVNVPVLLLSHRIIVPSRIAHLLYADKYSWLNRRYCRIPLLFDDEAASCNLDVNAKEYVSYIGTVAADHAFDRFVEFVDAALEGGWLLEHKFLIATRSTIPKREREILQRHLASGRLLIREASPMTTGEINDYFQRSIVVWNAYNRSTQSGVLPKAYMFGSAVIMLRRSASEFVDQDTCVLIEDNANKEEIRRAVEEIVRQRSAFAERCRARFLETFYYKSLLGEFRRVAEGP